VAALAFPLVPARRGMGLDVAGRPSRRRGPGTDVASTRPYRRGDAVKLVDWAASARLSSARGSDEFVVRDHFAEDAVRVVVVLDRSPSMGLCGDGLPWLRKHDALQAVTASIVASAVAEGALLGFAEVGADIHVEPPRRDIGMRQALLHRAAVGEPDGAVDSVDRALALLARNAGRVPAGTFVFVVSDFLPPPGPDPIRRALAAGWDLVPVVVQDPVWERSFPDVAGVGLQLADPVTGSVSLVRLSRRQVRERREENERRWTTLGASLDTLGLDAVSVTSVAPDAVLAAFMAWAEGRVLRLRGSR
jgi:uncharacterized protein (DUF58 family)